MITHLILFVIDGMRPDGLQQANTPTIDRLIAEGAHTFKARTVMPSVTLPCHTSLFHGVEPGRHGITTNTWMPMARPVSGLVDVLHAAGKTTAFFYNWEELRDLARPGSLDFAVFMRNDFIPNSVGDYALADQAARVLSENDIQFAFVYLGHTDTAGHNHGWMSDPYIKAIGDADRCIQTILSAVPGDTAVIVTADHGGHAQTHGTDSDEDMTTPFVIKGPGIPKHTITQPVHITDIAPTVTQLMGVQQPKEWIGKPIVFS